jgi:peptide/nickel transport system substrate-binding protein
MKRLSLAVLAVLLLISTGWAGASPVFNSADSNNLVIGTNQEPSNLNPWEGSADTKENVMSLLFLGLTYIDQNGVLKAGLATEVPTEANGRVKINYDANGKFVSQTVNWSIRSDANWSDGQPITCDDAEFTFAVQDRTDLPISTHGFSDLIMSVACTSGAGGKDFQIAYDHPSLFFSGIEGAVGLSRFYDLAPKHIWEPLIASMTNPGTDFLSLAPSTATDPTQVVGSGPFKLREWNISQFLTADRRSDFIYSPPGDAAKYVQQVTVRFITDQNTLLSAVFSGEVDATDDIGLAGQNIDVVRSQLGTIGTVEPTPSGFIEKLNFNLFTDPNGIKGRFPTQVSCKQADDLLLWDKRTRQAIIQAINRAALSPAVFPGSIISNSFIVGGDIGFNTALNTWEYDPAAAKILLAALGWSDSNNDGVLDRTVNGNRIDFRLPWVSTQAGFRVQTGQVLQQDLAKVGIALDVQNISASVLFSSEFLNHGSDCVWAGIVEYAEAGGIGQAPADPLSDELYANDLLESPSDPEPENAPIALNGFAGVDITGWYNVAFDQLRASALSSFDTNVRSAIVKDMQVIYNDELPTVPLYERTELVSKKTGLLNYSKGTAAARTQFVAPWCWGWQQNGATASVC